MSRRYGYAHCPRCEMMREFVEYKPSPGRTGTRWRGRGCNHEVTADKVHIMPMDEED